MFRIPFVAICLLVVLLLPGSDRISPGEDITTEFDQTLVSLHDQIISFLEGVSMGQAQSAYRDLLSGSRLLKHDALTGLIEKTNELEKKYGENRGFEQIATKRVGTDLVLLKYLYKCESFPVVWYFTYYRTPGETPSETGNWRVVTVRFDTELELLAFGE